MRRNLRQLWFLLMTAAVCAAPEAAFPRSILWTDFHDGGANDLDRAMAVSVAGDNVFTAGFIRSPDGSGQLSFFENAIVRVFTADGDVRATTVDPAWSHQSEFSGSVTDGNGNAYLAGRGGEPGQDNYLLAAKVRPDGQVAWTRRIPVPAGYIDVTSGPWQYAAFRNGVFYIVSTLAPSAGSFAIYAVALAETGGSTLWQTAPMTGPAALGAKASGLAVGDDGSGSPLIALAGTSDNASGGTDLYLARLNPLDGSLSAPGWEMVLPGVGTTNEGSGIALNSTLINATGYVEDPGVPGEFSAVVVGVDFDGTELWRDNTVRGAAPSNTNRGVVLTATGNAVFVAGLKDEAGFLSTFVRAYRTDNGALLWDRDIPGSTRTGGPVFIKRSGLHLVLGGYFPSTAPSGYSNGILWLDASTGVIADNVVFGDSQGSSGRLYAGDVSTAGRVFAAGQAAKTTGPRPDFFVAAADVSTSSVVVGGGGGLCSASPVPVRSAPPVWEWALPFAPALLLAVRRRIRWVFCCNKGSNP